MTEKMFITAEEAAEILGISKAHAYKILQTLNKELQAQGYITISGKINKRYFLERTCYGTQEEKKEGKVYAGL